MSYKDEDHPQNSEFRKSFRYFKSRDPKPDLGRVLDISELSWHPLAGDISTIIDPDLEKMDLPSSLSTLHLNPQRTWKQITFSEKPGLIFWRDVLSEKGQISLAHMSLKVFTAPEYKKNLGCCDENVVNWEKLRWVTLGLHYNWDTKEYPQHDRSQIPEPLYDLTQTLAGMSGFHAIANYYGKNHTLAGHQDKSEKCLDQPLIAISLGQSGVYLSGGATLSEEPLPLWLRSGDILIMSGSQRLVYHAMARIVCDKTFINDEDDDVIEYLNDHRINISVRQVM